MSDEYLTIAGQRQLLAELEQLTARRGEDEASIPAVYAERDGKLKAEFEAQRRQIVQRFQTEYGTLEEEYQHARSDAQSQAERETDAAAHSHDESTRRAHEQFKTDRAEAKQARNRTRERTMREFEQGKNIPLREYAQLKQACAQQRQSLAELKSQGQLLLKARRIRVPEEAAPPMPVPPESGDPQHRYSAHVSTAQQTLERMEQLLSARFIYEGWPVLLFLALGGVTFFGAGVALNWSNWPLIVGMSAGTAFALTAAVCAVLWPMARQKTLSLYDNLILTLAQAEAAVEATLTTAKAELEPQYDEMVAASTARLEEIKANWKQTVARLEGERDQQLAGINEQIKQAHAEISQKWNQRLAEIDAQYQPRLQKMQADHDERISQLTSGHHSDLENSQNEFQSQWNILTSDWRRGADKWQAAVDFMNDFCRRRFPDWEAVDFSNWQPPSDAPPAVRFGRLDVKMSQFQGGAPQHADLAVKQTEFELPALLTFPECPSLLLEAEGEGRDVAIRTMQNVMMRMLASLPPGKVRFTIIDPVGRGQNFSAFMHLADFDDQLVTSRIWTESAHINRRLTDVTEHMENVIQKYLRNEFESIQAYNRQAGEVAEPYRVLVVANYPANFTEEAARRLISIADSGARCGVSTLISVDRKLLTSPKFDLADLESSAVTLHFEDGHFQYKDQQLGRFPLQLDPPPSDAVFTTAVRTVGQAAEDSSRVEVPFSTVMPADDQWWTSDSRGGIEVPLGRAGATKLQHMRLGRGTSQHVLIAGKTGSGKSTLLNALITNLSAHYGPDEIEFYLIDFKKGVEFKPYATYALPQARVVAIESEREFGLSVLERLDEELKRRGDLLRKAGVQDVRAWRDAHPSGRMPRILLIVDEFQELFVADDRIAREATLLLDRLVRQGRAFGIHVILGTQTLAGAYSLARSTIGQMAVRVALQCSESDAHLILSEDNTAARLLGRPGAAIYNDANGLMEGNHPFQVVWLADHEREALLQRTADLAASRGVQVSPAIVFEGNVPSNPQDNPALCELIVSGPTQQGAPPRAWLGSSVAIKEPTYVEFARHAGTNMVLVGQHEELAGGVLATAVIALAAHAAPGRNGAKPRLPEFVLLDGARPDETTFGFWRRIARSLPEDVPVHEPKQCGQAIAKVAAVLAERMQAEDESAPPLFLVISNLSRFRDLQRSEDDFGFTNFGEEETTSPAKHFKQILQEGPACGIHVILWCDSYNNFNRWIDRQSMRDVELRVLLQMSATDSSNLIDSPAAGSLGVNRAVLYNDQQGEYEKFRPYGRPTDEWLAWASRTLAERFGGVSEKGERAAAS